MSGTITKAALRGTAYGAAGCAVVFLIGKRYTLSNDWLLAVMIVLANASGFAVAARFGVNLIGVAIAGVAGMMAGGWLGTRLIGDYEYKIPTPQEDRVMRIIAKGQECEIEVKGVPEETIKRIPIGGGLGVLFGWAIGAGTYAWCFRARGDQSASSEEEPDDEPCAELRR